MVSIHDTQPHEIALHNSYQQAYAENDALDWRNQADAKALIAQRVASCKETGEFPIDGPMAELEALYDEAVGSARDAYPDYGYDDYIDGLKIQHPETLVETAIDALEIDGAA